MSYLQETLRFQYNPSLFKLEKVENDIRKCLYRFTIRSNSYSKDEVSSNLIRYKNELSLLEKNLKGINWTAFLLGFALYHTAYIFRSKILLNEMGNRVFTHLLICSGVGLLSGSIIGYSYSSNFKLYKRHNLIKKELDQALQLTK